MAITHVLQYKGGFGVLPPQTFGNAETIPFQINAFATGEPWTFDTEPSDASLDLPINALATGEPWTFDTEPSDASLDLPINASDDS